MAKQTVTTTTAKDNHVEIPLSWERKEKLFNRDEMSLEDCLHNLVGQSALLYDLLLVAEDKRDFDFCYATATGMRVVAESLFNDLSELQLVATEARKSV